jgi:hypothetical protein
MISYILYVSYTRFSWVMHMSTIITKNINEYCSNSGNFLIAISVILRINHIKGQAYFRILIDKSSLLTKNHTNMLINDSVSQVEAWSILQPVLT